MDCHFFLKNLLYLFLSLFYLSFLLRSFYNRFFICFFLSISQGTSLVLLFVFFLNRERIVSSFRKKLILG